MLEQGLYVSQRRECSRAWLTRARHCGDDLALEGAPVDPSLAGDDDVGAGDSLVEPNTLHHQGGTARERRTKELDERESQPASGACAGLGGSLLEARRLLTPIG